MIRFKRFLRSLVPRSLGNCERLKPRHPGTLALVTVPLLFLTGCSTQVTFPSYTITDSLQRICKESYNLDVIARVSGHTIGVLFYTDHLVDQNGQIEQELIRKTLGDLALTTTRVALSTDLDVHFVVVAVRGNRDGNEIRIVRNVVDIKKAQTDALRTEEVIQRTLWEQAKFKEDPIDPRHFALQDITLEDFLVRQIVQRIRFASAKEGQEAFFLNELVDGKFRRVPLRTAEFSVVNFQGAQPELNVLKVLRVVAEVYKGYRFENFDLIVVKDLLSRKKLVVDRAHFRLYLEKKLNEEDLIRFGLKDDFTEPDHLRNAIEIFGFNFQ